MLGGVVIFLRGVCMDEIPEYKLILLGEPGVGKTNFFFRLRDGVFVGSTASTVCTGVEHMEYKMRINGSNIKVSCECLGTGVQCLIAMPLK